MDQDTVSTLVSHTKEVLDKLHKGEEETPSQLPELQNRLQVAVSAHPASGPTLGPLLAKIRTANKLVKKSEHIIWTPMNEGWLRIGSRPGRNDYKLLKFRGATHILSLLVESEGALADKALAESEGISWIWLPMQGAHPPPPEQWDLYISTFESLSLLLRQESKIYIHCSAGLHRTGAIAYGLLRFLGHSEHETEERLTTLRAKTARHVGEHRKAWADLMVSRSKDQSS